MILDIKFVVIIKNNYASINNNDGQLLSNSIIESSTNYAEGLYHEEQDFLSNRYEVNKITIILSNPN